MIPGTVILVNFPFTDLATEKKRPALVINTVKFSPDLSLITIAMITSQTENQKIEGDLLLKEWKKAKLLHPSLLRLSKLATIDSELVNKSLGHLGADDIKRAKSLFKKLFPDWI